MYDIRASLRRLFISAAKPHKWPRKPWLELLEDRTLFTAGAADPFIQGLYQVLLQRTPAAAEVQGWASAMDGGLAPAQVVDGFLTSAEFNGRMVRADYRNLLGREPEAGIANYWLSVLGQRADYPELTAEILASPEYFANHGGSFQACVVGLYHDVLGRQASQAEQNGCCNSFRPAPRVSTLPEALSKVTKHMAPSFKTPTTFSWAANRNRPA
jgi:hypothetical protein